MTKDPSHQVEHTHEVNRLSADSGNHQIGKKEQRLLWNGGCQQSDDLSGIVYSLLYQANHRSYIMIDKNT